MIEALGLAIRSAFGLVLASMLPLFAIAVGAALVVGLLGSLLGVRDAGLMQVVRMVAVLLGIGLLIDLVAQGTVEFALQTWAQLDGER